MRKNTSKPICIELFAGAGGLMLGLEMAGFKTVIANELHPHPCMTLRKNFPDAKVVEGSIIGMSGDDLFKKAGLSRKMVGEIDLLAGGPPCQGFSTAGLKNPMDARNNLVSEFVRMVEELRPRFFLLENVTGLLTMYEGKLFEALIKRIEGIGYQCHHQILKASHYGVPQMRKRLVILGARDGSPPPFPIPTHIDDKGLVGNAGLQNAVTCGDALGDLPPILHGEISFKYEASPRTDYQYYLRNGADALHNHQAPKHRKETRDYYSLVPPGGTWLDIPVHKRKKKQGIQRFPLNGIARTITSEPTDFLHPTLNRVPTVRELARIQSFPDWFEFLGQRTTGNKLRRLGYCSQTQQVGNAVPPLLARAIGTSIFTHLLSTDRKELSLQNAAVRLGPIHTLSPKPRALLAVT